MKIAQLVLLAVTLNMLGCMGDQASSTLSVTPEVASLSRADEQMFRDLLASPGGVGFADSMFYPDARSRVLTDIEVVSPYSSEQQGIERWYVQHDGEVTVSYLVELNSDGAGGTYFSTSLEE